MSTSKEELLKSFQIDANGIITSGMYGGIKNAFVGQPLYVAWYWVNFYDPVSGGEDEDEDIVVAVEVTHEDVVDFPELAGREGEDITIKREMRNKIFEAKRRES
jgi:hypothetical protein